MRQQVSVLATEVLQLSLVVFLQQVLLGILNPQMLKLLRHGLLSYFPEQAEDRRRHALDSNVFVGGVEVSQFYADLLQDMLVLPFEVVSIVSECCTQLRGG